MLSFIVTGWKHTEFLSTVTTSIFSLHSLSIALHRKKKQSERGDARKWGDGDGRKQKGKINVKKKLPITSLDIDMT